MKFNFAAIRALFLSLLIAASASPLSAMTFKDLPSAGALVGSEIIPFDVPLGGGLFATNQTTLNALGTFIGAHSILSSANLSGPILAPQFPILIGDISTPGASLTATLATVNSNVGTFGASNAIPAITVDGKGRVTAISTNTVAAAAGGLTGTALASNVTSSSLTSFGTITNINAAGVVSAGGVISTTATGDATSPTTGSFVNAGGAGFAKSVWIGTTLDVAGTSTLHLAPIFSSLTGYLYGNGASSLTASTTIPTTALSGALQAAQVPAFTGDITTTAGALGTTLATVNTNTGSWGSSTAIPVFTVNGKGLITAAATAVVVAPAGTLSGTTLASGVVTSSLTALGTLGSLNVSGVATLGVAPIFTGQTGYSYANGSSALTFSTTIPAASLSGTTFPSGIVTSSLTALGTIANLTANAITVSNLLVSNTAPTISSGCGSGAAITTNNGPAAFKVTLGTTTTTACVIGLPTAANGWVCKATDITTNSTAVFQTKQTASGSSASAAGFTNYSDVAVATAWANSDVLLISCLAY